MSRRIFTYRVEDSADYVPPGFDAKAFHGKTYFVVTSPQGIEVACGFDMDMVRSFCNYLNYDILNPVSK